jgi:hypothetical protein
VKSHAKGNILAGINGSSIAKGGSSVFLLCGCINVAQHPHFCKFCVLLREQQKVKKGNGKDTTMVYRIDVKRNTHHFLGHTEHCGYKLLPQNVEAMKSFQQMSSYFHEDILSHDLVHSLEFDSLREPILTSEGFMNIDCDESNDSFVDTNPSSLSNALDSAVPATDIDSLNMDFDIFDDSNDNNDDFNQESSHCLSSASSSSVSSSFGVNFTTPQSKSKSSFTASHANLTTQRTSVLSIVPVSLFDHLEKEDTTISISTSNNVINNNNLDGVSLVTSSLLSSTGAFSSSTPLEAPLLLTTSLSSSSVSYSTTPLVDYLEAPPLLTTSLSSSSVSYLTTKRKLSAVDYFISRLSGDLNIVTTQKNTNNMLWELIDSVAKQLVVLRVSY